MPVVLVVGGVAEIFGCREPRGRMQEARHSSLFWPSTLSRERKFGIDCTVVRNTPTDK
jgi:hypothetical protein